MKTNELLRAVRLQVWNWPAVINFTMSGTAAGFYLINLFFGELTAQMKNPAYVTIYKLTAPLLVSIGFLVLIFEAGRPLNGKYLFNKLKSSWMSREVLSGIAFICFTLTEFILPSPVIKAFAAAAAVGLLFSQGFMVFRCYAVIAWNEPIMPIHFLVSGVCLGFGLILLWASSFPLHLSIIVLLIGFIFLIFDAVLCMVYWRKNLSKALQKGTRSPAQHLSQKIIIGLGRFIPAVFLLLLIIEVETNFHFRSAYILCLFVGVVIIFGNVYQKYALMMKANYLRKVESGQIKLDALRT